MIDGWPLFYEDLLAIGNPNSSVGVCTLWTKRRAVTELLDPARYSLVGNLYRSAGISAIIRNVFANPQLRHIVVWGNDLSESGDSIVAFWENGIDEEYGIRGAAGKIEPEIDRDSIRLVRQAVNLVDLRGTTANDLVRMVYGLPSLPRFSEPRQFPVSVPQPPMVWPSESIGFRFDGATVARVWLRILRSILRYGVVKKTRYGNTKALKEILNVVAIVREENPDDVYFPEYLPMSEEELGDYYDQLLTARAFEGTSYTYGSRLRDHNGIDQISEMVDLISRRPSSKKLFATTWDVDVDTAALQSGDCPCMTQINGSVRGSRFYLTAHFRSQDMFAAWPPNMFAVRKLQQEIAARTGLQIGPTTMITHSAHIYAWDWECADEVLQKYHREAFVRPRSLDPRGYAKIEVSDGMIELTAFSPDHEELVSLRGLTASNLSRKIARLDLYSEPSHLLYLGEELHKAEIALRLGADYEQDQRLEHLEPRIQNKR